MSEVDILIVGFGFSVIPLLRELDRSEVEYAIVSEQSSVWDRLSRAGRLDFDLVSSYYTSFYSFDLVAEPRADGYPSAREFYEYHQRHLANYRDRITDDFVETIRNFEDGSVVKTRSGRTYKAKFVVVSTAFKRQIVEQLTSFDYEQSGRTIVFNATGDSANLMISKLVPSGNDVICLHNGLVPVDKIMSLNGVTFTLDQLEFHNFGFHFRRTYRNLVGGGFCSMNIIRNPLAKALQVTFLAPLFCRYNFPDRYQLVREHDMDQLPSTPLPNGVIAVKYWPIDKYAEEFAECLPDAISAGYLLNDLAFFSEEGLVRFWPREKTSLDREARLVSYGKETVQYDHLVEANAEVPNLPKIVIVRNGREVDYEYQYRENFYGVMPRSLSNIFFLGVTRPTTGGLANITEMQCLLIHRMLTNDEFRQSINDSLSVRLDEYNRSHYLTKEPRRTDHLVWYGSFTEEVARLLGINIRLRDCRTLKDLNQYLFLPNNAFKYRQRGEYAVAGCEALVDKVYREHHKYSAIRQYVATFILYRLLLFEYSILLYMEGSISAPTLAIFVLLQVVFAKLLVIPTQNYFGVFKTTYLAAGAGVMVLFGSKVFLPLLLLDFGYTYFKRQRGFRHLFNDLKNKPRYRDFFKQYQETYARMRSGDGTV